jgi:hypothetical protein
MPCSDNGQAEWERAQEQGRLAKKVDELTAMLCRMCKIAHSNNSKQLLPNDIATWYKEHQKVDLARIKKAREKLKQLDKERALVMKELGEEDDMSEFEQMGG